MYTVANESRYLLVFGVPRINLLAEVKREFQRYGALNEALLVTEHVRQDLAPRGEIKDLLYISITCLKYIVLCTSPVEIEQFTDVYRIVFDKLEHARRAKKFSDAKNFYGGVLHVSYAPECESVDDLRQKLQQRVREVQYRIRRNAADERQTKAELANHCHQQQRQDEATSAVGVKLKRKYDVTKGEYVDELLVVEEFSKRRKAK